MASKYRNVATVVDGIRFDSKKEAHRYGELKLLKRAGEILWFIRQPSFDLGLLDDNGRMRRYRADFLIAWEDGRVSIEDVKGFKTPEYKLKKAIVEKETGITIDET